MELPPRGVYMPLWVIIGWFQSHHAMCMLHAPIIAYRFGGKHGKSPQGPWAYFWLITFPAVHSSSEVRGLFGQSLVCHFGAKSKLSTWLSQEGNSVPKHKPRVNKSPSLNLQNGSFCLETERSTKWSAALEIFGWAQLWYIVVVTFVLKAQLMWKFSRAKWLFSIN